VTVVTRNEWGEKWVDRPAALSRRFIIRQMSMPVMAFFVRVVVFRFAVRKMGPSVMPAART
jgi:hypothetical protein